MSRLSTPFWEFRGSNALDVLEVLQIQPFYSLLGVSHSGLWSHFLNVLLFSFYSLLGVSGVC